MSENKVVSCTIINPELPQTQCSQFLYTQRISLEMKTPADE